MIRYLVATVAAFTLLSPVPAHAQQWPSKPIRFIVGFPPGGGIDFFARALGQKLQEQVGQAVVIENRAGANGIIGADAVAKAAPDGYTVLIANEAQIVVNQHLYRSIPYDPVKDLAPVTEAVFAPIILYAHPSTPISSVKELVDLAKAKPGSIAYASVGAGTPHHLTGELFKATAKIDMLHVPYKGGGPATAAMLGGEIPIGFAGYSALGSARSGKLKAIAVTRRVEAASDLPTFAEAGYPEVDLVTWHGVLVPAGTPKEIIDRLHDEVVKAIHSADLKARFAKQGFGVTGTSPAEFAKRIQSDIPIYAKVVKQSGAKLD